MAISRFLAWIRIKRMQRRMRERIVLGIILLALLACCCMIIWLGMVNYTLRDVLRILPTYTPAPLPTQDVPRTQAQAQFKTLTKGISILNLW